MHDGPPRQDVSELIRELAARAREEFDAEKRELSFHEYLVLVQRHPRIHARTAAQYAADCFAWLGHETQLTPFGEQRRYGVFDHCPAASDFPVIGLDEVCERIHRHLAQFAQQGAVNRLLLLHGPNGSAKTSLIHAVARALESYSHSDEGPLYRYTWVFPVDKVARRRLGFADEGAPDQDIDTYAHLSDNDTAATLPGELNESPLLLLPPADRRRFLQGAVEAAGHDAADFRVGRALTEGEPCPRSKKIFEALLRAYQGDLQRVWRHVRVERLYLSRRYRTGLATVEPQLHVDAGARQLTMDQGLAALPPTLKNVTIQETFGDLVDANRGLIEYNDLLKRPVEAFKYLLATCEKSTVSVPGQNLSLDVLFFGSSNEALLNQFKASPEFASFKGRIELVRVPYLRDYRAEARIYDQQVAAQLGETPVAPHTTALAALWAVMTRMKKPDVERYPEAAREVIGKLGPLEKADLYAEGRLPDGVTADEAAQLRAHLTDLRDETLGERIYEGLFGASPREMKTILFNAASRQDFGALTPLALVAELREFIKDRSLHIFLQIESEGPYHDCEAFIARVEARYAELITAEVRASLGLIGDGEFTRLLGRYLDHVSHAVRKERIRHPLTGQMVEPDRAIMKDFEQLIGVADDGAESFRHKAVQRVGAWRVDHPDDELDLEALFAAELRAARRTYHERNGKAAVRTVRAALDVLQGDGARLDDAFRSECEEFLAAFRGEGRYDDTSLREALTVFLRAQEA